MRSSKRALNTILSAVAICVPAVGFAQPKLSNNAVKIGVLTDLSAGFSDLTGSGSVLAARMAIDDFGGKVLGSPIELTSADTMNKADVASNAARKWYDVEGVDYIVDMPASSVALAVAKIAQLKSKLATMVGPATTRLTNEDCSPTVFHWAYDTYALATGTARAVVKQGGDSWYFLTADYAGGHALEKDAADVVRAAGGKVIGTSRHPFPASDFSSFLMTASSSGAKVIGLANAGTDTINSIKQAAEFGITQKQTLAATLLFISDVHSLGLAKSQGMYLTTGFYWDLDNETRAFSKRFFAKQKKMPTMAQAGVYSAVSHYLKAVKESGTDDPVVVAKKMKELPVKDFFARNGKLREDGRMVHDMYLAQVKKPADSKYPWDYYWIRQVIPGDQAFLPLAKSTCSLVKK